MIRSVHVYLTADQIEYLYHPGSKGAEGYDPAERFKEDLAITQVDDHGWIFVENSKSLGEDGSGVWVDAVGQEHHAPLVSASA